MLTAGILLMVVSVLLGVIALALIGVMVSAGRRRRAARAQEENPFRDPRAQARAAEVDPPRWLVMLATLSGAGLVLGLLLVMIPSVT